MVTGCFPMIIINEKTQVKLQVRMAQMVKMGRTERMEKLLIFEQKMVAGCFQWITNLHEKILAKLLEKEGQKVVLELMVEMDVMVKMERMELVLYLKSRIINDMYHIMMVLLGKYQEDLLETKENLVKRLNLLEFLEILLLFQMIAFFEVMMEFLLVNGQYYVT